MECRLEKHKLVKTRWHSLECIKFLKAAGFNITSLNDREFTVIPKGGNITLHQVINNNQVYKNSWQQLRGMNLLYLEQCLNENGTRLKIWREIHENYLQTQEPEWYLQVYWNWTDLIPDKGNKSSPIPLIL